MEETVHAGPLLVRARVDLLTTFAGVDAYALPEYDALRGRERVTSILRNQSYYHAYGGTVRPRLELEAGRLDSGVDLRADWFEQITGRDRGGGAVDLGIAATDRRLIGRTFVGFRPTPHIRLSLMAEARERMGRIEDVRSRRAEIGMHGGIESLF